MKNKILVHISVPEIGEEFDLFVPMWIIWILSPLFFGPLYMGLLYPSHDGLSKMNNS